MLHNAQVVIQIISYKIHNVLLVVLDLLIQILKYNNVLIVILHVYLALDLLTPPVLHVTKDNS